MANENEGVRGSAPASPSRAHAVLYSDEPPRASGMSGGGGGGGDARNSSERYDGHAAHVARTIGGGTGGRGGGGGGSVRSSSGVAHVNSYSPGVSLKSVVKAWSLSDFRIVGRIGAGRVSAVYLAQHKRTAMDVALKCYLRNKLDAFTMSQIRREIEIHSNLRQCTVTSSHLLQRS